MSCSGSSAAVTGPLKVREFSLSTTAALQAISAGVLVEDSWGASCRRICTLKGLLQLQRVALTQQAQRRVEDARCHPADTAWSSSSGVTVEVPEYTRLHMRRKSKLLHPPEDKPIKSGPC